MRAANRLSPIKVVRLALEAPLEPIEVEDRYAEVLLVVTNEGRVLDEIRIPALSIIPADLLRSVIAQHSGDRIWRRHLGKTFLDAARGPAAGPAPAPLKVSVVVCTRDRADQLEACLSSLRQLDPPPHEILVVDNCPSDDAAQRVCARLRVRYLVEDVPGQARARNRGILETSGDLVAFTDDDCVVDRRWLAGLEEAFADPLVAAVNGYVGPAELETPAQILFQLRGGFDRGFEPKLFHTSADSPARVAGRAGAGANMILRRRALVRVGLFAEDLGPGTPARAADETYFFYRVLSRGDRVVFDPSRIVWHRHRRDMAALRRILFDYGVAVSAFSFRCLFRHREPAAVSVLRWWWFVHLRRQLALILRREPERIPFRLFLGEIAGSLAGPWVLLRSKGWRRVAPLRTVPARPAAPPARPVEIHEAAPELAVVIPSHDRRELLGRVLSGLATQSYPSDRFETVVVLDACSDGSADHVRSLDLPYRVRLIEHDLRNVAASRNRGVRAARQAVVLFLDDDVVPERDTLAAHAEAHRSAAGEVAVLGDCPPVVDGRGVWELLLRSWWFDHYRRRAQSGHPWTYTDFASANASLARETLLRHSYDESFPSRREDWELGFRLLAGGVRFVHCAGADALHYLDTSFATALRQRREDARADVQFAQKHPNARSALPVAAFLWSVDDGWLEREVARAGRTGEGNLRLGLQAPLLRLDAALHTRGRWRRRANRLFRRSYLLGLSDALRSPERVAAFAASIFDSAEAVRIDLEKPAAAPVASLLGTIELEIARNDAVLGRTVAIDPGAQWDWYSVTDRVVKAIGGDAREVFVLEEFARIGMSGPRGVVAKEAAGGG